MVKIEDWMLTLNISGKKELELYAFLYGMSLECESVFIGQKRMKQMLGFEPKRQLDNLRKKGLVDWESGDFGHKSHKPNIYRVIDPRKLKMGEEEDMQIKYDDIYSERELRQRELIDWIMKQSVMPEDTRKELVSWVKLNNCVWNVDGMRDTLNELWSIYPPEKIWERIHNANSKGWKNLVFKDDREVNVEKEKKIVD